MASKFTVIAFHSSHPSHPRDDEQSISLADFTSALLADHGVIPNSLVSMTLRDQTGKDARCWFSWYADSRRYGTDFHIRDASGIVYHTIKMPGFWYSGTR